MSITKKIVSISLAIVLISLMLIILINVKYAKASNNESFKSIAFHSNYDTTMRFKGVDKHNDPYQYQAKNNVIVIPAYTPMFFNVVFVSR